MTKRLDTALAAGEVWHVHALKHMETGVYDRLMSRSDKPDLPDGFRRIDPLTDPDEYWRALATT